MILILTGRQSPSRVKGQAGAGFHSPRRVLQTQTCVFKDKVSCWLSDARLVIVVSLPADGCSHGLHVSAQLHIKLRHTHTQPFSSD